MDSFNNLLNAACHIKSYQMNQDKKMFEKLPEFYKVGLYCYDMFKNVRKQDFFLKVAAFNTQKQIGLNFLSEKDWDEAEYCFCKCLSIFKYVKTKAKNWKNEGIKDEDLEYFEDQGNNDEEKAIIQKHIISCLLNISLCNLEMRKYEECREACNEVLIRDPKNIKA
jgi:tetratricopeptide (TPR) repeat protein